MGNKPALLRWSTLSTSKLLSSPAPPQSSANPIGLLGMGGCGLGSPKDTRASVYRPLYAVSGESGQLGGVCSGTLPFLLKCPNSCVVFQSRSTMMHSSRPEARPKSHPICLPSQRMSLLCFSLCGPPPAPPCI